MGSDGTLNLAPIEVMVAVMDGRAPFHGGSVTAPAQLQFTAACRDEFLRIWHARGLPDRPPAVKPLRDGMVLGLAPCGMGVSGRLPLKWGKQNKEVAVNLMDLLSLFKIEVPRGQLMDMEMSVHTDATWGEALVSNLERPPFRPRKRRGSRNRAEPPAATGGT